MSAKKEQTQEEAIKEEEEYKEYVKEQEKKKAEPVKVQAPKVSESYLSQIQNKLNTSNTPILKQISKQSEDAAAKVLTVKNFEEYFRPFQEKRTLLWNELGKNNSYDLPININAGKPLVPANYSKTITLHFNSASKEQMQHIENIRGKSSDLDRIERLSNTMSADQMEKKGLHLPKNYLTISTEAAQSKEDLLHARICIFTGVDEDTAKEIAVIADSRSLDDILDSWEYRNRTGYPNSDGKDTLSTSQSGYA